MGKNWHDERGKFASGNPGGPGKGRAPSGRTKALNVLDALLGEEKNLKLLKKSFLDKFMENPADFFKTYVMPLIPKNVQLDIAGTIGLHPIQNELEKLTDEQLIAIADETSKPESTSKPRAKKTSKNKARK